MGLGLVGLGGLAVACGGDKSPSSPSSVAAAHLTAPSADTPSAEEQLGTLRPTLTVKNGSDQEVGTPDLYIVTRDQRHVDGKVAKASSLEPSASGDYAVTFPDGLVPDDIGLVVLELGGVNWGALGPKLAGG